mmetsp:Transcript_8084/g.16158  ORF Transcript_8084/g.16158 Transcript_8084/m.16158 type:complete len:216 (-) Transcript_8084:1611-2258(-)
MQSASLLIPAGERKPSRILFTSSSSMREETSIEVDSPPSSSSPLGNMMAITLSNSRNSYWSLVQTAWDGHVVSALLTSLFSSVLTKSFTGPWSVPDMKSVTQGWKSSNITLAKTLTKSSIWLSSASSSRSCAGCMLKSSSLMLTPRSVKLALYSPPIRQAGSSRSCSTYKILTSFALTARKLTMLVFNWLTAIPTMNFWSRGMLPSSCSRGSRPI